MVGNLPPVFFSLAVGQAYVFHDVQSAFGAKKGGCREESRGRPRGDGRGRGPIARLIFFSLCSHFLPSGNECYIAIENCHL